MSDLQPCFVIAPIGEPDSDTRKRSDQVLKHVIRPAVEECGYQAVRADEIDRPGLITSQVIQRVVSDPLVVADLTERNPNVFYELAIRHAIRKPLVQIIKKGERIPFDVANQRTVQVDHHDLDSVDSARSEITAQIRSLEDDPSDLETPISVSLELQLLRQSEDPEERSLAQLVGAVAEVRGGLAKIEARLGSAEEEGVLEQIQQTLRRLPSRIQERSEWVPSSLPRAMRFHPMMVRELLHISQSRPGDPIGVLVLASLFRDDFPWLYEIGREAYKKAQRGPTKTALDAVEHFQRMIEITIEGPWLRESIVDKREYVWFREELPFFLKELLSAWRSSSRGRSSERGT